MKSPDPGSARASDRFSRERRVRRRAEFQQVFDRGTRLQSRFFTLLLLPTARGRSRLGIVASRKIGGAVQRNRAKRLIREMFRQLPAGRGASVDAVVIPRREFLDSSYSLLAQEFQNVWRRGVERISSHARG